MEALIVFCRWAVTAKYYFLLAMEEPAPGGLSLTIAIGYQPPNLVDPQQVRSLQILNARLLVERKELQDLLVGLNG